ncbi:MAG: hypothetical protein HeimC2_05500 [Candidatus Heimdallarchaeota archaeon LC_2]|nr:MAG: hypothetical protein HeimC2_05500 [Candidatus Heimdallarchaeota archaeon LC_2]
MSGKITPRGSWILLEKELRLLFKTKRRIFILIIIPLIILSMGVIGGFAARTIDDEIAEPTQISILDENPSNITNLLKSYWAIINDSEIIEVSEDYSMIIEEQDFDVFIYIPSNFTNLILDGNISTMEIIYNSNSFQYQSIAFQVLQLTFIFEDQLIRSNNPDIAFDLVNPQLSELNENDGIGDDDKNEFIAELVIIPVYIIFFVIISPMSLILISVTIEREQKTLEMLFLQPVKRRDIVLGKVYYGLALTLITLILDIAAGILAILLFILISGEGSTDIMRFIVDESNDLGLLVIFGFVIGLIVISVNIIAFAVLLSLLAKDEREANMISGILPMLIFGIIGFIFVVPLDDFSTVTQAIFASLPVIGIIISIYLSGLAGEIIWISYLSIVAQIIWAILIIGLITRISEADSILELNYSKVFREIKRFIFRK